MEAGGSTVNEVASDGWNGGILSANDCGAGGCGPGGGASYCNYSNESAGKAGFHPHAHRHGGIVDGGKPRGISYALAAPVRAYQFSASLLLAPLISYYKIISLDPENPFSLFSFVYLCRLLLESTFLASFWESVRRVDQIGSRPL